MPLDPLPARLIDAAGRPVRLDGPDRFAAEPHRVAVDGGPDREIVGWAGPWPVQSQWWAGAVPGARLQVLLDGGAGLLLVVRDGRWWVTGIYD